MSRWGRVTRNFSFTMIPLILVLSPILPSKRSISRSHFQFSSRILHLKFPHLIPQPASISSLIPHPAEPMLDPPFYPHLHTGCKIFMPWIIERLSRVAAFLVDIVFLSINEFNSQVFLLSWVTTRKRYLDSSSYHQNLFLFFIGVAGCRGW